LTPAIAANGAPLRQSDGSLAPLYGFGWFLNPYRGHRRYAHYGETVGFRTAIQRFPDDRLTVIILANRAEVDAPALAESVADLYFFEALAGNAVSPLWRLALLPRVFRGGSEVGQSRHQATGVSVDGRGEICSVGPHSTI